MGGCQLERWGLPPWGDTRADLVDVEQRACTTTTQEAFGYLACPTLGEPHEPSDYARGTSLIVLYYQPTYFSINY